MNPILTYIDIILLWVLQNYMGNEYMRGWVWTYHSFFGSVGYCIMVGCTIIIVGKETMRDQYVEYVEYVMTRLSC